MAANIDRDQFDAAVQKLWDEHPGEISPAGIAFAELLNRELFGDRVFADSNPKLFGVSVRKVVVKSTD